jgi:hypothetical protein
VPTGATSDHARISRSRIAIVNGLGLRSPEYAQIPSSISETAKVPNLAFAYESNVGGSAGTFSGVHGQSDELKRHRREEHVQEAVLPPFETAQALSMAYFTSVNVRRETPCLC